MHFDKLMTNDAVLAELGLRLEQSRLQQDLTQAEMAERAGIGEATLRRLEAGQSVQVTTLLKLLRAMGLLGALDEVVPETVDLPISELRRERGSRRRARARSRRDIAPKGSTWRWADERERST
jgi:transcriptional regulator with XRE-family HTH domain